MTETTTTKKTSASRPPCPHGVAPRGRCLKCFGCPHGRQRSKCVKCGGSEVCTHGRVRYRCKDCGGKGMCEHRRQRALCKECGGRGICGHGRQRNKCVECGGSSICGHGRQRQHCRECGGSSVCEHGRQRNKCAACKVSVRERRDCEHHEGGTATTRTPLRNNIASISRIDAATRTTDPFVAHRPVAFIGGGGAGGGVCRSPRLTHRASTVASTAVHCALPSGGSSPTGSAHHPGAV